MTRQRRLRSARKAAGYNITEAAQLEHKSASAIKSWESENGHDPRLADAARICRLYGITLDWYVMGRLPRTPLSAQEQRLLTASAKLPAETQSKLIELLESWPYGKPEKPRQKPAGK